MKTHLKQILLGTVLTLLTGLFFVQANTANATGNVTFRGGYYTNISGYNADVNGNISGSYNGDAECSPSLGYCNTNKNGSPVSGWNVQKYICKGKFTNCDGDHNGGSVVSGPSYSTAHYIYDTNYPKEYTKCGYTIQLDVNSAHDGFMTWYSGDCSDTVNVCTGTLTRDVLQNDLIAANYPGPFFPDDAKTAYNNAACPAGAPTATPTTVPNPTATPTKAPTPTTIPNPTATPTKAPTPTTVPNPTATPTPKPTVTPTPVPNATVTPTPTATPTVTPTPVPATGGTTTVQCPDGSTIMNTSGQNNNTVVCNSINITNTNNNNSSATSTTGDITLAGVPAPIVTTTVSDVKELPKTGLPIEAWGLSGMLPIGFGLKKFVSDKNSVAKTTANFIWQQREFLKK